MTTIRTLICPKQHIVEDFKPEYFCDTAADGTPFNSTHLIYQGQRYIGVVFKDFPEYPYEIAIAGVLNTRVGRLDFEESVGLLLSWDGEQQRADQEWRKSVGLSSMF